MTTKTDAVPATPSSQWRTNGEPDPHGKQYDCERAALTLGKLTDDELANGVFMNGDRPMDINRILARAPEYHAPIVWLTAAKERIRWLSRALERACARASVQEDHIADERKMVAGEVQAEAMQEAYQQFLDDTADATLPYARHALTKCIAECQALSYSEDRGITVSEAESIGGVLHELRRLQNLEAEAVAVITTSVPTQAVRVPEGFVLVPVKPNDAMQAAGAQAVRMDTTAINRIWTANAVFRAMVDAASSAGDKEV